MQYVTATEAKQKLAAMLDTAQSEPVTIRKQNRDVAVVMSSKEYNRLRGLNVEELEAFCDRMSDKAKKSGLTEAKLNEILASED